MIFIGISKDFSLADEQQYTTIGQFWDEMAEAHGLENLQGLGYRWEGETISYAIGLKDGIVEGGNFSMELPDDGWTMVEGETDNLQEIYADIYEDGALRFEIETFSQDGKCRILYFR